MKYLDFKIRIEPVATPATPEPLGQGARPASYRVLVESPEGTAESTLTLPFVLEDLDGLFTGAKRTVSPIDPLKGDGPSPRDFGVGLFEALFSGEVRLNLERTLAIAKQKPDTGTRIRLVMNLKKAGMAPVARLPWELMRFPEGNQDALALSNLTLLVRALDVSSSTDPQPFRAPLRILVVKSNPQGTAELGLEEEGRDISENWKYLPGVKVDFVDPRLDEVRTKLAGGGYHVIHYMGHGDFGDDIGGSLLLTNADGSPHRVTEEELRLTVADASPSLRLVLLNACKTGTTSGGSSVERFRGVATSLVEAGVTAVVAMQFPVSDDAAIKFADTFYKRIARAGFPVDAAVAEARKDMYSPTGPPEWATPVVFLRSTDGVLFESQAQAETNSSNAPAIRPSAPDASPVSTDADPWGAEIGDDFKVFFASATSNPHRALRRQLVKQLQGKRVRVAGLPPDDARDYDSAVRRLVCDADLCVHLLSDAPGEPIDTADAERTFPLEQLEIGRQLARPQLVLIPDDVDIDSIQLPEYKKLVQSFNERPRDATGFEFVRTGRNQLTDTVIGKIELLKEEARRAAAVGAPGSRVRRARVDAYRTDLKYAQAIESFLIERNIDVKRMTTVDQVAYGIQQFEGEFREYPLYVVVAGSADKRWVKYRWEAALRAAVNQHAEALVAEYSAPVPGPLKLTIRHDSFEDSGAMEALIGELEKLVV
jgi:CHAT domain